MPLNRSNILRLISIKSGAFSFPNSSLKPKFSRFYRSLNSQDGQYAIAHTTKPSPYLDSVQEKTVSSFAMSRMMVSSVQGSFLKFLVQTSKAKRVLEIGAFTGYSALCMAEALQGRGPDAKVVTLEKSEEYFKAAKENIESSGLGHLIDLKLGDAREIDIVSNLDNSVKYDLIFLDADKGGYIHYYNIILERDLLSDDGFIVADNVLFGGHVSQVPKAKDLSQFPPPAKHLHAFNEHVANDEKTTQILLPCFDGIMLIQKKASNA
ncbi:1576_t:CDS:2 [Cetraspora pellucida]|uniref:1576_t:CDS:1 n=1 Tax=Cetraspora pellucida TaxID=1433469 RepID=A0A9N9NLA1_9GLOM|nr:1576_t:CDS:2 [Cetraspora pellucida]